jgi:hypothetical protein
MDTNENAPLENNFRLNRIKRVSRCFRLFLQFGFPLILLAAVCQSIWTGVHAKPVDLSQINMGLLIVGLAAVLFCAVFALAGFLVWYWTALKLFNSFESGILFTAETARYLKILGGTFFVGILAELGVYLFNPLPDKVWPQSGPVGDISSCVFNGIFMIFIGWLFDEARKIREEQELTV